MVRHWSNRVKSLFKTILGVLRTAHVRDLLSDSELHERYPSETIVLTDVLPVRNQVSGEITNLEVVYILEQLRVDAILNWARMTGSTVVPDDFWERASFEVSTDEKIEDSYDIRRRYCMLLDEEVELAEISLRVINT